METASSRDEAMTVGWNVQGVVDVVSTYARAVYEDMG